MALDDVGSGVAVGLVLEETIPRSLARDGNSVPSVLSELSVESSCGDSRRLSYWRRR